MSSKHIKSVLKEIREDIKNKDYKAAIQKCEDVLLEEPNNYMALVFIGACYQEKDKKEAAKYLRKALTCGSDQTVALQGLLNCAEIEELPDILKKLLKLTSQKYFEYHNKLSNISTNSKNLESCIEILENETIENKNNSARIDSAWKNLAKIFIKLTEIPKKWETLYENTLTFVVNDKDFEFYIECSKRLLKLLYKIKKYDQLLFQANTFHEYATNEVYPLEWICKIYSENYNENILNFKLYLKQPINYYSDALLNLNDKSILGLLVKAIVYYQNEEYMQAYELLLKTKLLSSNNNNNSNSYNSIMLDLLAKTYMKLGAYGMAVQIWRQLELIENNYCYVKCLSFSKVKTDLIEVISITEKIAEKDDNVESIINLIRAYYNLNEIEKAQKILLNSEKIDTEKKVLLKAEFFMQANEAIEELDKISSLSDQFMINFLKGQKYFEMKEYEKSLIFSIIATKERPYFSECFVLLGQIYFELNDLVRARKCYEKCISLNPQNEIAVTNLSAIYRKLNEWNLNGQLLENTVNSFQGKQCPWALFQLGLHYLNINQYDQAIRALQTVNRLDLDNTMYLEALADAYQQRGSYNSAMKVNEKILQLDKNNLIAKYQVASLRTILRMYKEAIELFDEILIEHPNFIPALKGIADAHYGLAKNLFSQRLLGRYRDHLQNAINNLQKAFVFVKKDFVWLWRMMANIFTLVGCLPKSKSILYVSGKLAGQEEDIKEIAGEELFKFAEKFYMIALRLHKEDHLLWHELALCYYKYALYLNDQQLKVKNLKSAIEACKQAIFHRPSRWENWNLLGIIFATNEINDLALSQHCFIKALNIDKRAAIPWTNLGLIYLSLCDIKLSNLAFRKAQQSNPNYINAWIGQAIIAEQIGEDEEAMDLFRHCTQLDFNLESAIGYAYWVCLVLLDSEKMKQKSYKYAIEQMHAIPIALDSITWYFNVEETNSSAEALSYLGYLNYKQSLWNPAIKAYQIASKNSILTEEKDMMLCNLGYTYLKNNEPNKAIEAFTSINEANLQSVIGLALANSYAGNIEDSYSMYESALEWLANSDLEKSLILMEMSAILYSVKGETETKEILYQLLALSNVPIEALYFACALGIIHKDWELADAVLDEMKKYEDNPAYCHHIAFLTAYYYSGNKQPKKGLIHLLQRIHIFPDQPLLRKALAEYLLKHSSKTKKRMHIAASQIAQSIIPLGLLHSTTSIEAAKALLIASISAGNVDTRKQRILAQSAIHMDPTCKEAWVILQSC